MNPSELKAAHELLAYFDNLVLVARKDGREVAAQELGKLDAATLKSLARELDLSSVLRNKSDVIMGIVGRIITCQ
jgi:hypothetical protein